MNHNMLLLIGVVVVAAVTALVWPQSGLLARFRRGAHRSERTFLEDALKYIRTVEAQGQKPRIEGIAGALAISTHQATELTDRLVRDGLATFTDGCVSLTDTGKEAAIHIIRAHRLWERYLSDRTGYGEREWHPQAEIREHLITPEEADSLARRLGNPSHDPHGDPIPRSDGSGPVRSAGIPLQTADAGGTFEVVHLEDEPEAVYAQLVAIGLHPGSRIEVLEKRPDRLRFALDGVIHTIAPIIGANITVLPVAKTDQDSPDESTVSLDAVPQGKTAQVVRLARECRGAERRRLLDLGIVPGTEIVPELVSAGGDPRAYRIRETLIALRDVQARHIYVTEDFHNGR